MKIEVVQCGMCKHYDSEQYCEVWEQYITNDAFYCACGIKTDHTADTPQTDCDKCIWNVCNYNKVDWDADTPQTDGPSDDDETIQAIYHLQKVGWLQAHDKALTEPQTERSE